MLRKSNGREGKIEKPLARIYNVILWLFARMSCVDIPFASMRSGEYPLKANDWRSVQNPSLPGARFIFDQQESGSERTEGMVKQLLTVSGVLAGLLTAIPGEWSWWRIGAVTALIVAVALCMRGLSVQKVSLPNPSDESRSEPLGQYGKDLIDAALCNAAGHEFRVDLYRSAQRWFVVALLATTVSAGCESRARPTLSGPPDRTPQAIRESLKDALVDSIVLKQEEGPSLSPSNGRARSEIGKADTTSTNQGPAPAYP